MRNRLRPLISCRLDSAAGSHRTQYALCVWLLLWVSNPANNNGHRRRDRTAAASAQKVAGSRCSNQNRIKMLSELMREEAAIRKIAPPLLNIRCQHCPLQMQPGSCKPLSRAPAQSRSRRSPVFKMEQSLHAASIDSPVGGKYQRQIEES